MQCQMALFDQVLILNSYTVEKGNGKQGKIELAGSIVEKISIVPPSELKT